MAISMLKIRWPLGRLIFNMGIAIPGKTVFLIETAPRRFDSLCTKGFYGTPGYILNNATRLFLVMTTKDTLGYKCPTQHGDCSEHSTTRDAIMIKSGFCKNSLPASNCVDVDFMIQIGGLKHTFECHKLRYCLFNDPLDSQQHVSHLYSYPIKLTSLLTPGLWFMCTKRGYGFVSETGWWLHTYVKHNH